MSSAATPQTISNTGRVPSGAGPSGGGQEGGDTAAALEEEVVALPFPTNPQQPLHAPVPFRQIRTLCPLLAQIFEQL